MIEPGNLTQSGFEAHRSGVDVGVGDTLTTVDDSCALLLETTALELSAEDDTVEEDTAEEDTADEKAELVITELEGTAGNDCTELETVDELTDDLTLDEERDVASVDDGRTLEELEGLQYPNPRWQVFASQ